MVSKAELAGNSTFKDSSSGPHGFEKKGSRIQLLSKAIQSGDKSTVEVALQPTLVDAADDRSLENLTTGL